MNYDQSNSIQSSSSVSVSQETINQDNLIEERVEEAVQITSRFFKENMLLNQEKDDNSKKVKHLP